MKNLPYYMVSMLFLVLSFCVGGALVAGADYIRNKAYKEGVASTLIYLELDELGEVDTRDL